MLLLIQLGLAAVAAQRGWGWYAAVPLLAAGAVGLALFDTEFARVGTLLGDFAAIYVLLGLAVGGREKRA